MACGHCDAVVLRSEVEIVEVRRATRDCPAEGEERCVRCFSPDPGEDEDRVYDEWVDRQYDRD